MKIEFNDQVVHSSRGGPVEVGNVYTNPHGRAFYKIVLGKNEQVTNGSRRRWNNIVMIHVNVKGEVIGCAAQPETYVSEHQDLIGRIKNMPTLKVEWIKK